MEFSDIDSKNYNDINEDIFGNRIIILKRIKSLKQLKRTEKELVRLNYKEAIIKGFTMKGIQQYIASKKDLDRVVLPGIPEEGGGAGEPGMVLPHGQGPFCVCRSIQEMHRRD